MDRFGGFAELERWIARGHLLVVRGFTPEGDVIVNDPAAASDEGVRRVYKRELFQRAWLDRSGVVYIIYPER